MSGTQVQGREEAFPPTDGQKHSFLPWVLPSPGWSCSVQIRLGALSYSPSLCPSPIFPPSLLGGKPSPEPRSAFSLAAARLPRLSGTAFLVVLHLASQQDTKPKTRLHFSRTLPVPGSSAFLQPRPLLSPSHWFLSFHILCCAFLLSLFLFAAPSPSPPSPPHTPISPPLSFLFPSSPPSLASSLSLALPFWTKTLGVCDKAVKWLTWSTLLSSSNFQPTRGLGIIIKK